MHKNELVQAINAGFSSAHFQMFTLIGNYLLEKVMDFMKEPNPPTLQAVSNVGQQDVNPPLPPIFVLSPDVRSYRKLHNYTNTLSQLFMQLHLKDEGFP